MDNGKINNKEKLTVVDELLSCIENLCTLKSELWVVRNLKMENCLQWPYKHCEEGSFQTDSVWDLFS